MRLRPARSADERSAAALRRLAVIGADLSGDGRDDGSDEHPEMVPGDESPHSQAAGRHLAPSAPRRRPWLGGLHDRLPAFVHARLGGAGLTAQHVVVVVAVVVGFIAVAVWWLASSRPSEVSPVDEAPAPSAAPQSATAETGSESAPPGDASDQGDAADDAASAPSNGKVVVDVTGKVRRPGIVELADGSRVADALEAAGGPKRRGIDLSSINLARVLVDGEQIVVGMPTPETTSQGAVPEDTAPESAATDPSESGSPVNLNTATLEELDTLPGVGPVTGQAIIDWRSENDQFTSVDELIEVDGIGEVTLEELRDLVTI